MNCKIEIYFFNNKKHEISTKVFNFTYLDLEKNMHNWWISSTIFCCNKLNYNLQRFYIQCCTTNAKCDGIEYKQQERIIVKLCGGKKGYCSFITNSCFICVDFFGWFYLFFAIVSNWKILFCFQNFHWI